MVEFENLDLPVYKVCVLYRNGDVREFLSNDFERAYNDYRSYFYLDSFDKNYAMIKSVRFFNGSTGTSRFLDFD